jgi:quercetin 2,3-dioxygenase
MITIRKSEERGHFDHGWLDTYHTFSFAGYRDPAHMGFRSLRVINEDRVQPGQGFGMHGHRDMEIVTCVLEGTLAHRDSMGNVSTIQPGELQRMTAGTGIRHSEFNPSPTETVHLLQIWILPERKDLEPEYEQRSFPEDETRGRLRLVASRDGRDGSLTVHQAVALFLTTLEPGASVRPELRPDRYAWLHVARGAITLNDHDLRPGDGAAVNNESPLEIAAREPSELLLFDLA